MTMTFCRRCFRKIAIEEKDRGKDVFFCGKCVPQEKVTATTQRRTFDVVLMKTGMLRVGTGGRILVDLTEAEAHQLVKSILDRLDKKREKKKP